MERAKVLTAPKLVGGVYEVGEHLGSGSFGEIFRAKNLLSGEEVAIKFVTIAMTV